MPTITIQTPLDQPSGKSRLMTGLKDCLKSEAYDKFRLMVAFAKAGPLLRLENDFIAWKDEGKSIEAIFGVDEKGTSVEALEFALKLFDEVHIAHVQAGAFNPTFHLKIYHFKGGEVSRLYIGSNNLTVGGIETNSETNICLDFNHTEDSQLLEQAESLWSDTLTFSRKLDDALLRELADAGMVVSEKTMRKSRAVAKRAALEDGSETKRTVEFPKIKIIPPSALPKSSLSPQISKEKTAEPIIDKLQQLAAAITEGLVIQISPHPNGEVHLSKVAVDQNRAFFEFPFSGHTTPKKSSNASYPQRDPDPIVDINVYSSDGATLLNKLDYGLNTVYYAPKSEIRITIPPEIKNATPPFSILVISKAEEVGKDYSLDIYQPGSEEYENYLAACNQTMPSGGNDRARMFGWL